MRLLEVVQARLRRYHPRTELLLFGGALVGLLVVVHSTIRTAYGFRRGGLLGQAAQGAFDSSAVVFNGAAPEPSTIVWGGAFYLSAAILTFAVVWAPPRIRQWISGGRLGVLTGGTGYGGYLMIFQTGDVGTWCALCLLSIATAIALLSLQVGLLVVSSQPTDPVMPSRLFKRELLRYVYLAAAALVLVGADVSYFQRIGPQSSPSDEGEALGTAGAAACELAPDKEPLDGDGSSLVGFQDVTVGPSDADVTVIEYFDPNCPHCKTFHGTMKTLVAEYKDSVRFVYKPFPLGRASLPEIQALYAAHQEGKFTEMLEAQYQRQSRSGITKQDLRAIAAEIGMTPDVLMSRVNENEHRERVLRERKRALKIGVDSTPTVLVNGYFVKSRSLDCMKTFVERAQNGTLASMAAR